MPVSGCVFYLCVCKDSSVCEDSIKIITSPTLLYAAIYSINGFLLSERAMDSYRAIPLAYFQVAENLQS